MCSLKDRRAVHKEVMRSHGPTREYLARKQALHEMLLVPDTYFATIPCDVVNIIISYHADPRVVLHTMINEYEAAMNLFLDQFGADGMNLDRKKLVYLYDWPSKCVSGAVVHVKYAGDYAIFVTQYPVHVRIYRMYYPRGRGNRIHYRQHSHYDFPRNSGIISDVKHCVGKYGLEFNMFVDVSDKPEQLLRIWPEIQAAALGIPHLLPVPCSYLPCGLGHFSCGMCKGKHNMVDDYGNHFATKFCLLSYTASSVKFYIS